MIRGHSICLSRVDTMIIIFLCFALERRTLITIVLCMLIHIWIAYVFVCVYCYVGVFWCLVCVCFCIANMYSSEVCKCSFALSSLLFGRFAKCIMDINIYMLSFCCYIKFTNWDHPLHQQFAFPPYCMVLFFNSEEYGKGTYMEDGTHSRRHTSRPY